MRLAHRVDRAEVTAPATGDQVAIRGRLAGGGFYTEHSDVQAAYGELGFQWLEQAATEVEAPEPPRSNQIVRGDPTSLAPGDSTSPVRDGATGLVPDSPAYLHSVRA